MSIFIQASYKISNVFFLQIYWATFSECIVSDEESEWMKHYPGKKYGCMLIYYITFKNN